MSTDTAREAYSKMADAADRCVLAGVDRMTISAEFKPGLAAYRRQYARGARYNAWGAKTWVLNSAGASLGALFELPTHPTWAVAVIGAAGCIIAAASVWWKSLASLDVDDLEEIVTCARRLEALELSADGGAR